MSSKKFEFMCNVEKRITPEGIAFTSNNAKKLIKLPQFVQKKIVEGASKNSQYMGFVVEPYSFFLTYEITDDQVKDYLPDDYELVPISIFNSTEKKKIAILGCFNVHTSVFWGSRFELYVIAKNKKTNLISWLIVDYESNTFNYDPGNGFVPATTLNSVFTTSFDGDIICNVENAEKNRRICFLSNIEKAKNESLNYDLWIEGNLSIDYSGELAGIGKPFGLVFDPEEMKIAKKISKKELTIYEMDFAFLKKDMVPIEICCFPYAQHYLTTVFPEGHGMKNTQDLYDKMDEILESKVGFEYKGKKKK